jgi:Phage integrase, N-terminal SAM-like domain
MNIAPERLTIEMFLTTWLEEMVRRRLRPRTYENYEQIVRMHLIPHLGSIQIAKLTPEQIYAMLVLLADEGKAANTIRNVRAVLRRALNQALRWGKVNRNVATLIELPRPTNQTQALDQPGRSRGRERLAINLSARPQPRIRWQIDSPNVPIHGHSIQEAVPGTRAQSILTLKTRGILKRQY